jgi:hypothetical protein
MKEPTPEERAELEAWLASRPPAVAAVVRQYPPGTCYRLRDGGGHYIILAYGETEDGGPVTATLAHGRDSHWPGVRVFGVDPAGLEPCGCGLWEWPTPEQMREMRDRIDAGRRARGKGGVPG